MYEVYLRLWKWKYEFIVWLYGILKVKWGRNEYWFNKFMISWLICVFLGCIYILVGFYFFFVYEVFFVYYGIIYMWIFNSIGVLVVCVLELFCVLCVVVYYDYMYVLFMRILGLVFDVFSGMF